MHFLQSVYNSENTKKLRGQTDKTKTEIDEKVAEEQNKLEKLEETLRYSLLYRVCACWHVQSNTKVKTMSENMCMPACTGRNTTVVIMFRFFQIESLLY